MALPQLPRNGLEKRSCILHSFQTNQFPSITTALRKRSLGLGKTAESVKDTIEAGQKTFPKPPGGLSPVVFWRKRQAMLIPGTTNFSHCCLGTQLIKTRHSLLCTGYQKPVPLAGGTYHTKETPTQHLVPSPNSESSSDLNLPDEGRVQLKTNSGDPQAQELVQPSSRSKIPYIIQKNLSPNEEKATYHAGEPEGIQDKPEKSVPFEGKYFKLVTKSASFDQSVSFVDTPADTEAEPNRAGSEAPRPEAFPLSPEETEWAESQNMASFSKPRSNKFLQSVEKWWTSLGYKFQYFWNGLVNFLARRRRNPWTGRNPPEDKFYKKILFKKAPNLPGESQNERIARLSEQGNLHPIKNPEKQVDPTHILSDNTISK
ncbi:hypothetical protein O181_075000 [Austropuccinia psidii MF-1]|uniref:Uncharacterized protein n=1 Tax=Austropuccinia psidii MF-1 TaxID=1389203 RepID=A0A9Q3IDK6_9BASI|nr:hypothetical protein [Austropuccinia psidii MF-1]